MKKLAKRYAESVKLVEKDKEYEIKEALDLVEKMPKDILRFLLYSILHSCFRLIEKREHLNSSFSNPLICET